MVRPNHPIARRRAILAEIAAAKAAEEAAAKAAEEAAEAVEEVVEEKPSFVNLTKTRKTKVLSFVESEGMSEESILKISSELNLNPDDVKEYLETV